MTQDTTYLEISEDTFNERYPLIANHLDHNASWTYLDSAGCLFETFGEELAFVQKQDPRYVWTLVDGENDDQYLESGVHFVNRIGYLISKVPVTDGVRIHVHLPSSLGDSFDEPDVATRR